MGDKIVSTERKYTKKEDFTDSTAPYEDVYKFVDDPFKLNLEIEKMSDIARKAGIKNFKTLFGGYCKQKRKLANEAYDANVSNFEGQEIDLNTGSWLADDAGISKMGPFGELVACVHPIYPVRRLVNIDTGIEKLEIAFSKGKKWRKMVFDRREIASANSIIALADYGVAVTSENSKYLVQWLHDAENLNYDRIPECNSVSRLGWIDGEGFSPYVDNLVFDGDISFKHFFESVKTHGSEKKWMNMAKEVRADTNIATRIMLAASFSSVLVAPCGGLPFFVHLWGGTETGKTVGLMLAASVWASPAMGSYIHTFNSTAVAQELSAGFVNSLPLILDELQVIKDRKDFDQIIYQLSEGVGRARGQKTGGMQRTNTWLNCILTSGEQPISTTHSGGGAVNRIIEINCEDTKLFRDPGGLSDTIKNNYGHAGKKFVEWLSDDAHMDEARLLQKNKYHELNDAGATEKQALAASMILTADELIEKVLFHDGTVLTAEDMMRFLLSHQEVSQNNRAYDWMLGWIAQNGSKFKPDAQDLYGKTDDEGNLRIISKVFNDACADAGFNPGAFLSWMKRHELILTPKRGNTKTTYFNSTLKTPCIVINTPEFREAEEGGHTFGKFEDD